MRKNRFSALEELSKVFSNIDLEPLIRMKTIYHNLEELDSLYQNSDKIIKVWEDSVSFFESLIKAYLDRKFSVNE